MGELRKDYILDRWVLIATDRAKRPCDFKTKVSLNSKSNCPFCKGNERMTPKETYVVRKDNNWIIRGFPNKFSTVSDIPVKKHNSRFINYFSASGHHEVLVETPDHNKTLADLPLDHINLVLDSYVRRILAFDSKYVLVFKNHGEEAGTSLSHSHSQIVAYNQVPQLVQEELKASRKFPSCPYCKILNLESHGPRKVFENSSFISIAPFASRFPLEVWIFPKKHLRSIVDVDNFTDLSSMLKKILVKLKKINASYNFVIHNAPGNSDFHFHIEILPRLAEWAGFEYGTNTVINAVTPEEASRFYRK